MDALLGKEVKVLDHGFVRVVDYMGVDSSIVQAARVSYGDGTKSVRDDAALIRYLVRNGHTSPLEMCEIKLHVRLPIFVARQWLRHRTANVNEYSARYSVMREEFYVPDSMNLQSTDNKQARSGESLPQDLAERFTALQKDDAATCFGHYTEMLDSGLAREIARIGLPLSTYTEMYWKIDLHNLLHFLRLRADGHAQAEIRAYADVILDIVRKWVPVAVDAFEEYKMHGAALSRSGLDAVRCMLAGQPADRDRYNMSKGEWKELTDLLKLGHGA